MPWRGIPFLISAVVLLGLITSWTRELVRLNQLRHDGRTALATVDESIENAKLHSSSSHCVTYHFVPRDSQTQYQGRDLINISTAPSPAQTAPPNPINIKYLPDDPSFNRVADTILDRVVSIRVSIVLTGTVAVLLAGCGLVAPRMNRTAPATRWSASNTGA